MSAHPLASHPGLPELQRHLNVREAEADIELRKWCIQQAAGSAGLIRKADDIYQFVTGKLPLPQEPATWNEDPDRVSWADGASL